MNATIDDVIQLAKEQSKAIVESCDEHHMTVMALTKNGVAIMQPIMEDKNLFAPSLIAVLRMLQAHAYVIIYEAWGTKVNCDSPVVSKLLKGEITVTDLPLDDREEILTVSGVENNKSYRSWFAKIRYTPNSERYLDEWQEAPRVSEGRMVVKEW